MQHHSHRRSFARLTILATCMSFSTPILLGLALYLLRWSSRFHRLPGWGEWLAMALVVVGLVMIGAFTALVAIGGFVVLHRDSCEDRGLPYFPVRPRERIIGPMMAAFRRFLNRRAKLLPGELAEVRSLPEIFATLDERGCLEGLPFMPEMAAYCGHRFPVHRRVDKVWEYAHRTGLRRVRNAVLLEALRCDGKSHGECQAACQLIWKEAWLRRLGAEDRDASAGSPRQLDLGTHTQVTVHGGQRYVCQMTEIERASTQLSARDLSHYWRDLMAGNIRLVPLLVVLSIRLFNGTQWRIGGALWPVLKPLDSDSSPHQDLGLQPGQMVRVKSKHAIELTLNRNLRNRGLGFGGDMISCCGGSYRVAARVDRIVDEGTGELLVFKTPSIVLEGANAKGETLLTPQNEFFFWREIWLEPHPSLDKKESLR